MFDNEKRILEYLQSIEVNQVLFTSSMHGPRTKEEERLISSLINENLFNQYRVNNAILNKRPDFVSKDNKFLLEVMRVDDHSKDGKNNKTLSKEREIKKELIEKLGIDINRINLFILADSGLSTKDDHNYKNLKSSIIRSVEKHSNKIPFYKDEYPESKKVVFFIMNESSGIYINKEEDSNASTIKDIVIPILDKDIFDLIVSKKDLDYVIYFSPFNYVSHVGTVALPKVIVIKLNSYLKSFVKKRNESSIISLEK